MRKMKPKKNIKIDENQSQEMKYFMNEDECDLTFIVENKKIAANKWLLRMKSDVFEAMLSSNNFKESIDCTVDVEDTKYEVFKTMIRFLYSHELVLNDKNDFCVAINVFRCADKYHIRPLMSCVEKRLIKMITLDNIEEIYEFARSFDLEKLCTALDEFIENNLEYYLTKSGDELKRISTLSNSFLMNLILKEKNKEIERLEHILSDLARNCIQCKNRITFSGI